jgi:hypothetical protein
MSTRPVSLIATLIATLGLLGAPDLLAPGHDLPQPTPRAAAPSGGEVPPDEKLVQLMKSLQSGQRAVKKAMSDLVANRADLLEQLAAMERAAIAIYAISPPTPETPIEGDEKVWRVRFRRQIAALDLAILDLQIATMTEDAPAAEAAYERLSQAKKLGHQGFRD